MTRYGHFTYFYKKGDYSIHRVLSVLFRINLLTFLLSLSTGLGYLEYYFAPLVSVWYLLVYSLMRFKSDWNDRTYWILGKIFVAWVTVSVLMMTDSVKKSVELMNVVAATKWNAKDWQFRVGLDQWVVFIGLLMAFGKICKKYISFVFFALNFQ